MLSHFKGYITLTDNFVDTSFLTINSHIGQLMVTLFFFYSGYGIYESVKRKGKQYVIDFPKKRLLFTWVNFAVCITFFLIEGLLMGKRFGMKTILMSYIGWHSLGNSNWFMFVTFGLYVLFFLSFVRGQDMCSSKRLIVFTILTFLFTAFLYVFQDSWWWDTLLCLPAGMWFSRYRTQIDVFLKRNKHIWLGTFAVIVACFFLTYYLQKYSHLIFIPCAVCFCLMIVWITMKIQIKNPILSFWGNHVFSIYILQRLWYILFSSFDLNRYIFMGLSIGATIVSAVLFDSVMNRIKRLF